MRVEANQLHAVVKILGSVASASSLGQYAAGVIVPRRGIDADRRRTIDGNVGSQFGHVLFVTFAAAGARRSAVLVSTKHGVL